MTYTTDNMWTDGDIDGVVIRRLRTHRDERGWLTELFRSDEMPSDHMPAMGYVSVTRAGVARGPHSHSEQTDYFGFVCSCGFELRLWDDRSNSATRYHMSRVVIHEDEPTIAMIPPGVIHGYRNISGRDGVVLNFPDRLYAGEGHKESVDEIRYENDEHSPFSMND